MPHLTSKDGTAIGYDRRGAGPPLILVSGATHYRGVDPALTPALADILAQKFSVFMFDRRGRGQSGDRRPYAVAREIEDIAALIALAGGEASLFGMATGALVALETAAALPRQVRSLVMYEPPIDLEKSAARYRSAHAEMAGLAEQNQPGTMMKTFLAEIGLTPEASDALARSTAWPPLEAVALSLEHDYRVLAEARTGETPPERWQNAIMPVLILNGDKSFPFITAGADWVASGLHNVQRVVLADQGHDFDPSTLAMLLTLFCQKGAVQVH